MTPFDIILVILFIILTIIGVSNNKRLRKIEKGLGRYFQDKDTKR